MVEASDLSKLYTKAQAITALFPYATKQEQSGQHELLSLSLRALSAMDYQHGYMWNVIEPFITTLLNEESPTILKQTAILASPYLKWAEFTDSKHLIQLLVVATSAVTYTDEIGQSMVDTLLQIASHHNLQPHISSSMWLWLGKCPLLPPVCRGHYLGGKYGVVKMVQSLGDIQILKSYLFHIWSEWDHLEVWCSELSHFDGSGLPGMCALIREDFGGIGMRSHQKELLERLDYILGQLDLGLDYLQQYKPSLTKSHVQKMKEQYGGLKKVLVEVDRTADILICEPSLLSISFSLLTFNRSRISLSSYVLNPSPMFIIVCLGCHLLLSTLQLYLPIHLNIHTSSHNSSYFLIHFALNLYCYAIVTWVSN